MEILFQLPLPFHISVIALVVGFILAWKTRYLGCGLPMAVVLVTVAVWYHGDALYNEYEEYVVEMGEPALEAGWWQVLIFVVAFGLLVQPIHKMMNSGLKEKPSNLMIYFKTRKLEHPAIQSQIDKLTFAMLGAWLLLMGVALFLVKFDFAGIFAPYLDKKENPWARGRVGGGLDAFLSLGGYVQIFLTAGFGVLAAVTRNPSTRMIAIIVCLLAFPFYIFDRTRNTMLATMMPGLLAWVGFRLKGGLLVKGGVLFIAFSIISFWFSVVVANRHDTSMTDAIKSEQALADADRVKHDGLSMFSELGYMNSFFDEGTMSPNWGARYFAEIVNPIPRGLWKNKPYVGVDYAVARGFGDANAGAAQGGISASIATGMIGQGIVNFGRILGPIFAAFLMAIWVGVLARQDLLGSDPARLLLYSCGMILTFNMGRDITLLVLYPFVFGLIILQARNWFMPPPAMPEVGNVPVKKNRPGRRSRRQRPSMRNR